MDKDCLKEPGDRSYFQLPENYFEDFQARLDARLDEMETPRLTMWGRFRPYVYFAAMFVLMFLTIDGVMKLRHQEEPAEQYTLLDQLEEISNETELTAEDILIGSLDGNAIYYYLYEDEDNLD